MFNLPTPVFKFYKCKKIFALIVIFSLIFSFCSCSNTSNTSSAFTNYCNSYFAEEVTSSTINLHYTLHSPKEYGIYKCPISFGHLDKITLDSYPARTQQRLQNLNSIDYTKLSSSEQLTYDILKEHLTLEADNAKFLYYSELLSPVCGTQAQLPILLSEYELNSEQDIIDYLSLLSTIEEYFKDIVNFEKEKANQGLFMPDFAVDDIVSQCEDFINCEENYLIDTFNERIKNVSDISETATQNYCMQNKSQVINHVIPAYKSLVENLSKLKGTGKNKAGLCYLPDGRAYYDYLVKSSTGSFRSIKSIYELTSKTLEEDRAELTQLISSNPDILDQVDTYNFALEKPEDILNDLKGKINSNFPNVENKDFTINYVHPSLAEHISPAFYLTPTIDCYDKNSIYINPECNYTKMDLYTTLAHEGFPGHMYQNIFFNSTNPAPIRHIFNYGGYSEGWATYVEMCSFYFADIDKNLAKALQLNNSISLGIYANLDILIHYYGYDENKCYDYLKHYGFKDKDTATEIFHIIIEEPANYLKYYLGYLEFLELKKLAKSTWGDNYTDMRFHEAVLKIGPCSFTVLEKYLVVE